MAVSMKETSQQYEWLTSILNPLRPYFAEILVISFFTNMLALAVPLFTLQVYDRVVGHNATTTLAALVIGVFIALIFDFLLRRSRSKILQSAAMHIDAKLGQALYERLTTIPLAILESKPTNYWRSLFQDTQIIRSIFSGPSAILIADIPFAILFIIVIFIIATPIAWLLLIIIPAFAALTWWSTKSMNMATARETYKNITHDMLISELLAGRATVKALMIDKAIQPYYEKLHAEAIEESYKRGVNTDRYIALGQSLATATTAILVASGALAIINREMTIGALIATTMLTARIISPLNQLLAQWRNFARGRQAIKHLSAIGKLPHEKQIPAINRPRPKGNISVEQLCFSYPDSEQPIIENCNFTISAGEMVGLIGSNGCGKSTLIKLMHGLYTPSSGRITIDNGDISQFSRNEMSQWVGYVPQDCFLFNGSIKDNIAKAWPEADDKVILAAAKLAGADQFIITLPNGYDTDIGEAGYRLSGGQRQRIAIARALLRNPPILLLDEVTSNLDNDSELILRQYLVALAKDRSILIATHSLPLLRACTRIMVMDKGKIVAQGTTQEMLAKITSKDQNFATENTGNSKNHANKQPSNKSTNKNGDNN